MPHLTLLAGTALASQVRAQANGSLKELAHGMYASGARAMA